MKKSIVLGLGYLVFSSLVLAAGGANGGGGNTINGKPAESYGKKITEFSSYNNLIAPKLRVLQSLLPDFAKSVAKIANSQVFYVLPRGFENIGEERTGLHFETEQSAIQCHSEVFFNEKVFNNMLESERADILLHEILLGAVINDIFLKPSPAYTSTACSKLGAEEHSRVRKSVNVIRNLELPYEASVLREKLEGLSWNLSLLRTSDEVIEAENLNNRFAAGWSKLKKQMMVNCQLGFPTNNEFNEMPEEVRKVVIEDAKKAVLPLIKYMARSGFISFRVATMSWKIKEAEILEIEMNDDVAQLFRNKFSSSREALAAIVQGNSTQSNAGLRLADRLNSICRDL
jgi:hypothetical protein